MKDTTKPKLEDDEELKTRGKDYVRGRIIDITDMDSQLICRVYNHNGRCEEISHAIRNILQRLLEDENIE